MRRKMRMGKQAYRVTIPQDPQTMRGFDKTPRIINLDNTWYIDVTYPDAAEVRNHPDGTSITMDYFHTGLWMDTLAYKRKHRVGDTYVPGVGDFIPITTWIDMFEESMRPEGAYLTASQSYIPIFDEDLDDDLANRMSSNDAPTAIEAAKQYMRGGTMSAALRHHSKVCINAINILKDFLATHPSALDEKDTKEIEVNYVGW